MDFGSLSTIYINRIARKKNVYSKVWTKNPQQIKCLTALSFRSMKKTLFKTTKKHFPMFTPCMKIHLLFATLWMEH